jgi:anthranilate phosphoribosyltransferase
VEEAQQLMRLMLSGDLSPLQLGATLMALRIKSETVEELRGFYLAAQETLSPLPALDRPVALLPCYNGARKLPALALHFAHALQAQGFAVLMHGVRHFPGRVTTYEVVSAYEDIAEQEIIAQSRGHAFALLASQGLAFIPIDVLSPVLDAALSTRLEIGLRSSVHTVVKMLTPIAGADVWQFVPITHGEYQEAMLAYYARYPAMHLVFRGAEGEPVPPLVRSTQIEGSRQLVLPADTTIDLPDPSAKATAEWIMHRHGSAVEDFLWLKKMLERAQAS